MLRRPPLSEMISPEREAAASRLKSAAEAYDAVFVSWDEYRSGSAVNNCVRDFARLIAPGGEVLDIGCGTGRPIDSFLAGEGFFVTGIDVSPKMIWAAKSSRIKNAVFENADILEYKTDKKFDAVIAFDSIWHVPRDSQASLYGIFAGLLRAGGRLLFTHGLTDGELTGTMFGEEFYYASLDKSAVCGLLRQNGFEIVSQAEKYKEKTTGERDLLITARKI